MTFKPAICAVALAAHGDVVSEFKVMFMYICLSVCVLKDEASIAFIDMQRRQFNPPMKPV